MPCFSTYILEVRSKKTYKSQFKILEKSKYVTPVQIFRSSHQEMFLRKGVLKIRSKFTGEHPCRSAISIKLQSNFIEIALQHGCSPVNLLSISRTPFSKNTSEGLLLNIWSLFRYYRWSSNEWWWITRTDWTFEDVDIRMLHDNTCPLIFVIILLTHSVQCCYDVETSPLIYTLNYCTSFWAKNC